VRIVFDTNVLIAAFVSRGVCHELLEHCAQQHRLVSSSFILREFEDKLLAKFRVPPAKAAAAVSLLRSRCEVVETSALAEPICRDPKDDWILATAITGRCACIVTGDEDLLTLEECQGIRIIAPGSFWAYEAAHQLGV
jgi:uncharacterized protein